MTPPVTLARVLAGLVAALAVVAVGALCVAAGIALTR